MSPTTSTGLAMIVGAAVFAGLGSATYADSPTIGHSPTAWERKAFASHRKAAMTFGDEYRVFIDRHRTEREVVDAALSMARKRGHKDLLAPKRSALSAGARVYAEVHGKLVAFAVVGKKPMSDGVHIVASHIDAVRIDLKQNPLYADGNLALLETHYYGSIKKYQWLSQPLELRGVVITKTGKRVDVSIGSKPGDPVLVIPDIAGEVSAAVDRHEGEEVHGENLDPIVTSTPATARTRGVDPFAAEAARLLQAQLGIELADLTSAELELVPAGAARDVGLDRAIVGGYGQDDRACTYAALRALLDGKTPNHTAIVFLVDKEEVGSTGNTGAQSQFVRRVIAELIEATGGAPSELAVDRTMARSIVFSADATGAVNPAYRELYDGKNASFMGSGVVWNQTAAHAELLGYVRGLLDRNGITHQPSTWTRTTGSKHERRTVLPYFTRHGMDGVEVSIPLLSMHAPFELVSKADLYEGYRAYRAFLED